MTSDTSPRTQQVLRSDAAAPKPRVAQPGELLFEFYVERTKRFYRCELRDHGPVYGVEAQFLDDGFPLLCHTFAPRLDPSRTPREMAIAWAEATRPMIEAGEP